MFYLIFLSANDQKKVINLETAFHLCYENLTETHKIQKPCYLVGVFSLENRIMYLEKCVVREL